MGLDRPGCLRDASWTFPRLTKAPDSHSHKLKVSWTPRCLWRKSFVPLRSRKVSFATLRSAQKEHFPFKFTFQVQLLLRSLPVYATFIKILNVHTHQYLLLVQKNRFYNCHNSKTTGRRVTTLIV